MPSAPSLITRLSFSFLHFVGKLKGRSLNLQNTNPYFYILTTGQNYRDIFSCVGLYVP